jgi:hypothetical protein
MPPLDTSPGGTLAVRLAGQGAPSTKGAQTTFVVGCGSQPALFVLSLLVSDAWPVVGVALWALSIGLFVLPFARDAAAARRARRGLPVVEVDPEPVTLGERLEIYVELAGPAALEALDVEVECRDPAGRVGPPVSPVPVTPLDGWRTLEVGEAWSHRWSASLPLERPATSDGVSWSICVRWKADRVERSARYAFRASART